MECLTDRLYLIVRSSKAPLKDYHFIFRTPADEGSEFFQRKTDLDWVEEINQLVRVDVSSNWLVEVDLSPLASCTDLEYLSLASNRLEEIDLSPLQNCKHLRNLDLSHNNLTKIDLTPLAECKNLRYLYLQENKFKEVNIAPLLGLEQLLTAVIQLTHRGVQPKIIIDSFISNLPPNLNDTLFAFFTNQRVGFVPDWLYDKNTEIEYSPKSYPELVSQFGWAEVKKHLMALSKKLKIGMEFTAQKIFLNALGIPELGCYDGKLRDIVQLLPTCGSYKEGVCSFQSKLVILLENQLEDGGSTLYFDVDALATTQGSVLIPKILNRRNKEMQEVILYDRKGYVDLLPLWSTSYGNKILKALGIGRQVRSSQLSEIQKAFNKINHDLVIEKIVYDAREEKKDQYSIGEVIRSHICNGFS